MNRPVMFRVSCKSALFTTLLFTILLSSLFTCIFVSNSSGASLGDVVHVTNEDELKNAISNASEATAIVLDNDITLTDTLKIPKDKDITLTSNKASGYYKLNPHFCLGL